MAIPPAALPYFKPQALTFLRGLARHNQRPWFEQRRAVYEQQLRSPMLALIATIQLQIEAFAPDHVRSPHRAMLRIYRDTRFARTEADKVPYHPRVAAWWGHASAPRTSGAGFYLHLTPTELLIAAGMFMPDRPQLRAIRTSLLAGDPRPAMLAQFLEAGSLHPELSPDLEPDLALPLPRGIPPMHPLAGLLRQRSWGVRARFVPEASFDPALSAHAAALFADAAPLVHLLNSLCSLPLPNARQ